MTLFERLFRLTKAARLERFSSRPMTADEEAHFDAAFVHMDKGFDELRQLFGGRR